MLMIFTLRVVNSVFFVDFVMGFSIFDLILFEVYLSSSQPSDDSAESSLGLFCSVRLVRNNVMD